MSKREILEQVVAAQQSGMLKERLIGLLEFKVIDCDDEELEWADFLYESKENFLNVYNWVHGGISAAIADSCMGMTVSAASQQPPSTTDLSVSYLRPMQGETFRIHVEIKKLGKQLASAMCEISDGETGDLCVTAMGRYMLMRKTILADERSKKLLDTYGNL